MAFEKALGASFAKHGRVLFPKLASHALESRASDLRRLASEIEALCPAVDRVKTPRNVEYPWLNGDDLVIPANDPFSELFGVLKSPLGGQLFRVVERMFRDAAPPKS